MLLISGKRVITLKMLDNSISSSMVLDESAEKANRLKRRDAKSQTVSETGGDLGQTVAGPPKWA